MRSELLSDDLKLTLEDICDTCGLSELTIRTYVEEGIVEVQGIDVRQWRFSEVSMIRLQKAYRLERDLRLNPAGVALALDLMSQIEKLKKLVKRN